jgi:signal transduction histidine kinase
VSEMTFDNRVQPGMTLTLSWFTAWQVNPGTHHLISYHDIGAGDYTLRIAGSALAGGWTGTSASLPIHVDHYLWQRPWFWPLLAGGTVALLGGAGLMLWRQRMQRRIERLAAQHTLEKDRARIARDMHDDLGARLTRISLLTALAEREITAGDAPAAQTHVGQLSGLAREVVGAIDEIVWAVDPGNDTLDHLGTYLCRFADEFFAGSPVRCRFGIPPVLPAVPLGAEVRHNLFLAVKEALNNIAKHAGPCEARLELQAAGGVLCIDISDNGTGFYADPGLSGNGLRNMERRLHDIGGECEVNASDMGTRVTLRWPLPGE